ARACVVAAGSRRTAGFIREEQLAALQERLEEAGDRVPTWTDEMLLEIAEEAGLAEVGAALREHLRQTTGVRGLFDRLGDRVRNRVFDLVHGGLFVATGSPNHEGHEHDGAWHNWTADYQARPQHFRYPASEEQLCELIADAERLVRVVGGGHSFNDS